jgi:hypothetical protein
MWRDTSLLTTSGQKRAGPQQSVGKRLVKNVELCATAADAVRPLARNLAIVALLLLYPVLSESCIAHPKQKNTLDLEIDELFKVVDLVSLTDLLAELFRKVLPKFSR